ncbi:MAG: MarR family transcriptional regulator [Phenylobacterium sp.]|uniref:MarR family winged helix-turn-helix transcriptional regulator n=1 Tax=Phenylobacterium sp. TaxID=1871053 RepID=UPI002733181C|nr:MarR family transcriptional regulator [Phenylobacterium sp.]MDP3173337.1 MarR family transcriptional regulator [Phenylobacterium sp.]
MDKNNQSRHPPVLTGAEYQALATFRHGVRRYLAFAAAGARSVGLTSHQHQALLAIKTHHPAGAPSIGDLANLLLVKHHSAVELVSRLVKAGLVQRTSADDDRRKVMMSLTEAGEAILSALSANNLEELRAIAPTFSQLLQQLDRSE